MKYFIFGAIIVMILLATFTGTFDRNKSFDGAAKMFAKGKSKEVTKSDKPIPSKLRWKETK